MIKRIVRPLGCLMSIFPPGKEVLNQMVMEAKRPRISEKTREALGKSALCDRIAALEEASIFTRVHLMAEICVRETPGEIQEALEAQHLADVERWQRAREAASAPVPVPKVPGDTG